MNHKNKIEKMAAMFVNLESEDIILVENVIDRILIAKKNKRKKYKKIKDN